MKINLMTDTDREVLRALQTSSFRARFALSQKDSAYACTKHRDVITKHAQDFIRDRLAPSVIPNDGKQTPMRHHPVFTAQHATATCCRGCLQKWYGIPSGRSLTEAEQSRIVALIMAWITLQLNGSNRLD